MLHLIALPLPLSGQMLLQNVLTCFWQAKNEREMRRNEGGGGGKRDKFAFFVSFFLKTFSNATPCSLPFRTTLFRHDAVLIRCQAMNAQHLLIWQLNPRVGVCCTMHMRSIVYNNNNNNSNSANANGNGCIGWMERGAPLPVAAAP